MHTGHLAAEPAQGPLKLRGHVFYRFRKTPNNILLDTRRHRTASLSLSPHSYPTKYLTQDRFGSAADHTPIFPFSSTASSSCHSSVPPDWVGSLRSIAQAMWSAPPPRHPPPELALRYCRHVVMSGVAAR